jgi:cysteine-rich repeat protein
LISLSACKEADSVVVVNVSIDSDAQPVYSLRVAMSTDQARDTKTYPASASTTPMSSTASFAIVLPRSRSGLLDLALDGVTSDGKSVAHGAAQTALIVGGTATVSVILAAGAALCGNGLIDSSETCDDGNMLSFDGCSFRCEAEGLQPDAALPDSAGPDTLSIDAFLEAPPDAGRAERVVDLTAPLDLPAEISPTGPDVGPDHRRDSGNPTGYTCTTNDQCASGYCTDGVCCQGPCASVCMACNLPASLGQCSMVPAGQDPRENCPQEPTSTCGRDGNCDGAGSCRRWANGTTCASAECTAGSASAARTCDGAGTCKAAVSTPCIPYACGGSACATQCSGDGDCDPKAWCNGSKCQGRSGPGGTCTSDRECLVGYSCRGTTSGLVCSQNL